MISTVMKKTVFSHNLKKDRCTKHHNVKIRFDVIKASFYLHKGAIILIAPNEKNELQTLTFRKYPTFSECPILS